MVAWVSGVCRQTCDAPGGPLVLVLVLVLVLAASLVHLLLTHHARVNPVLPYPPENPNPTVQIGIKKKKGDTDEVTVMFLTCLFFLSPLGTSNQTISCWMSEVKA